MVRLRLNELERSTWLRLEGDVQRFENAWSAAPSAQRPDIHAFLASCLVESDEQRQALLLELLLAEFEFHGREGEAVEVEGYLDRFPELREWPDAVAELQRAARNTSAALHDTASGRRRDTRNVPIAPPELDGFESLQELGRGGMGVVYRALQTTPRRTVAVKMIRNSHLASDAEKEQFRREAVAAGRLQHPHIVPIYEVGRHAGQPYFVMELVEGENLAVLSRDKPIEPRLSARYLCQAAEAIQYAHEQGVVHRDVKPANLLLDRHDNIRVTDFGLSRDMTDVDQLSMSAMEIGTPAYMPPEQTGVKKWGRVGPHSDIYSLGATLYDLLVGRPPFQAASTQETLWQVSEQDVPAPRLLNPKLDRDLETICLKCLEKDSRRRYESARELADDLRSYLAGRPIQARPIGRVERMARWARRNRVEAAMLAMLVFTAIGASIGMLVFRELESSENQARVEAVRQFNEAQSQLAEHCVLIGGVRAGEGDVADALIWFDRARGLSAATTGAGFSSLSDANPNVEKPSLSGISNDDLLRLMSGWCTALGTILPHDGGVTAAVFSPDGRFVGTASRDGVARLWNVADGTPASEPLRHGEYVSAVAFSPDGKLVATGSGDSTAKLWHAPTGQPLFDEPLTHDSTVTAVAFSPDGDTLATATQSALCLWEVATGTLRWKYACKTSETAVLLFTPDRRQIVASYDERTFGVWAVADGELKHHFKHELSVMSAAISPDGTRLATGTYREGSVPPQLSVWDLQSGKRRWQVQSEEKGHLAAIQSLAFAPGGELLSGANDGLVAKWNADSGDLLERWLCGEPVRHVAVRPGVGHAAFLAVFNNGDAFLWERLAAGQSPRRRNIRHPAAITAASFSPDGKWVLTGGDDGTVRLIEVDEPRFLLVDSQVATIALHPSRNLVAVGCVGDKESSIEPCVRLLDLDGNARDDLTLKCDGRVSRVAFSTDGNRLLACTDNGTLTVWSTNDWKLVFEPRQLIEKNEKVGVAPCAVFSPDGRWIYGNHPSGLQELNAETGEATGVVLKHADRVRDADFSRDGKRLLTAGLDNLVTMWETTANNLQQRFVCQHAGKVLCVAFAPDGRTFATGCSDNYIRIWSSATGQPDGRPMRHDSKQVLDLVYSPDGRTLYSGGENYLAYAWNVSTRIKSSPPMQHVQRIVQSLAVTRDGRRLLTGSGFPFGGGEGVGSLNVWDLPDGLVALPRTSLWVEAHTARRWDDKSRSVKALSFDEWNERRREWSRREGGK